MNFVRQGVSPLVDMSGVVIICGWVVKIERFRQQVDPLASESIFSPNPTCWPRTLTCLSTDRHADQHLIIEGWVTTAPSLRPSYLVSPYSEKVTVAFPPQMPCSWGLQEALGLNTKRITLA